MIFTTIEAILIAATPAITAIIGIISAFIKIKNNNGKTTKELIDKFETVKETVEKTKEYETLKDELALAHQENRELQKSIRELLTKIDRVAREEDKGE